MNAADPAPARPVGTAPQQIGTTHRAAGYTKAKDARKRPVRGVWVRNGRYYAQLTVEDAETGRKCTRRVPLLNEQTQEPVQTVPEAVRAFERLRARRDDNQLPILRRTPTLADYVGHYFATLPKDTKRQSTLAKERRILRGWCERIGHLRLAAIRKRHLRAYMTERNQAGLSARTVNLDVIALRNVLKMAEEDEHLKELPTLGLRPLKAQEKTTEDRTRELFAKAEIEALCQAALSRKPDGTPVTRNGQQFADYVRLLACSGMRRNEALALKWSDVDWPNGQLKVGQHEATKNGEVRVLDFHPTLKSHMADMARRRVPDWDWIFPSPQRGERDAHVKTFRESLELARAVAVQSHPRLATFGFHRCRHHFISMAIMSGIDFMTIAKWVGHKDGGILIGKVYGHLADDHRKRMAQRMAFQ